MPKEEAPCRGEDTERCRPARCLLEGLIFRARDVIAKIIKSELFIAPVGDIHPVCLLSVGAGHAVEDNSNLKAQELVHRSEQVVIPLGQIIIHCDHVDTLCAQGVQVGGQQIGRASCRERV